MMICTMEHIKRSDSFKDEEIYQKRRHNAIIIDSESDEDCKERVPITISDSIDSNFNQVSIKNENIKR